MSVFLPFLGVLSIQDRSRRPTGTRARATALAAAVVLAIGSVVCAATVASWATATNRWDGAAGLVLGVVVVQVVSMLCGTGFGLLLRTPTSAMVVGRVRSSRGRAP